jgi:hypothetical protein
MAEESAAYSLGTMQPNSNYRASPGDELVLKFYIFNAYGNRISHITLSVSNNPDNLEVILPPLETNTWNISGILTPIEENIYVEPMPIVEVKPDTPEPGIEYLKSPNVSGVIPAKPVNFTVKIPDSAVLGSRYSVTVTALAKWYGETGSAQVSQARPFSYNILVASKNYSESIYEPEEGGGGLALSNEMIFGIVIGVLVIVILFQQFRPKKHR